MKIAFAMLANRNPRLVERLVRNLVSEGHMVALHYDLKSPAAQYQYLVRNLKGVEAVRFARRVRVRWGEWSIVAASLNCLEAVRHAGWQPDYVYLLSGMDYPIRPCAELVSFLERNEGKEFIESVPSDSVRWVKTGPQKERYQYRFYFNWREQRYRFEVFFALQKLLRLKRRFVRGMTPYIGSQWWVLSWDTLQKIMDLARQPDILRFFRTTLVPDELFFQTLVRHLVPESRVVSRTLTLYQFTDYGCPVVYYADHVDYLVRQPFFMARKVSPHQKVLRDALDACWHAKRPVRPFDDADIGTIGPEYEDWRLNFRDGVPGRAVAGRPPGRWHEDQERLKIPYFAVIGTSSAELRLVHKALSQHPDILCHGQLFHPKRIEFADGFAAFAGYAAEDVKLRGVSAANFVADVVRAEKRRLSGLLLRWGQGASVPELMFDRPNVRVVLVRGDPLTSFIENLLGTEPLIDDAFDVAALAAIPPSAVAYRFRRFLGEYRDHTDWLAKQVGKAALGKPDGWVTELEFARPRAARPQLAGGGAVGWSAAAEPAAVCWREWSAKLAACLGVDVAGSLEAGGGGQLADEVARLEERRRLVIERLLAGGIGRVVLEALQRGSADPRIALALM